MPVEIRELIISATIVAEKEGETRDAGVENNDQLIGECVRQVLQILEDKKEP
ncbi:DUF5908 family protein [Maridesulfovibrio sp.]|uniref:DUF5908 family protein n=1 Tax=Maridesulfovibrio sp. TaxID=2795000 RepID=UPI0039F0CE22